MKPVLQKNNQHKLWFLYAIIFIVCTVGIGVALYLQYYQEQNLGAIFGITDEDSEAQDEYDNLKSQFSAIFTNQIENLQTNSIDVEKIQSDYDVIVTAYSYEKNEDNCTLDVSIPYFNINSEITIKYNQEIKEQFKAKAEELMESNDETSNIIYNVRYKAYIQNDILSLVIEAELKEDNLSQRIIVKTYNYNFAEDKEVTLEDLLEIKGIEISDANDKILDEIKDVQLQNAALAEQGYNLYTRDITSDIYDVENTENYFLGSDGMLYVIYAYGNSDYTSEMDIVIFN